MVYQWSVKAGYGAYFESWSQLKEAVARLWGYFNYLGLKPGQVYWGTADWANSKGFYVTLYPVKGGAPFNLEFSFTVQQDWEKKKDSRDSGGGFSFIISTPYILADHSAEKIPQRMPATIVR